MDETAILAIIFAGFAVIVACGGGHSERPARHSRFYLGPLLPRLARAPRTPSSAPQARAQLRLVPRQSPEVKPESGKRCA